MRRYGRTDAVDGLNLTVRPGRCYGFFGRNGAGKTTTIKCLLNLLRPTRGDARVFGLDPARDEVAVKSRLSYVPDAGRVLSVDDRARRRSSTRLVPRALEREMEPDLLTQFQLDADRRRATSRKASARSSR